MNIVLILSSVILNTIAQLLIRKGMLIVGEINGGISGLLHALPSMATNIFLWLAMVSYAGSILLWFVVLSKVEVSFAYTFSSVGFILSAVAAHFLLAENISLTRIIGILIICIGVILVSRS